MLKLREIANVLEIPVFFARKPGTPLHSRDSPRLDVIERKSNKDESTQQFSFSGK